MQGQKRGFAGDLPRTKLPDGSKLVALCDYPRLYIDRWYGSDWGGGQTMLYVLSEPWSPENPLQIVGKPVARLGYSGQITRRFRESEIEDIRKVFGNMSQSEIVWMVLKRALSHVNEERPFRGPDHYNYPELPAFEYWHRISYISTEDTCPENPLTRVRGEERISFRKWTVFSGSYDFVLIKRKIEDKLIV